MESSFTSDAIHLRKSIVHIKGCQIIIFIFFCILLSKDHFTFTNSVDPDDDEMLHYAAFHLVLHCLIT